MARSLLLGPPQHVVEGLGVRKCWRRRAGGRTLRVVTAEPERKARPLAGARDHGLRLVLSVASVAFLWIAIDYLLSFQRHVSESFRLEVGRWLPVLGAAIAAGLLFGIAMALPLGRGYRPLRVVVLGLPPAVFLAQFAFTIWWATPHQWKSTWWLDRPRLFFSPAAQIALGTLFGLALAAGFTTGRDSKLGRPTHSESVGPAAQPDAVLYPPSRGGVGPEAHYG